ncbi:hypothetical protein Tco_0513632 [Tanacetum coccineum]
MLAREDYVEWSSRIIRYCKSKPNGKLLGNSILWGPYKYKEIIVPVEVDDQAIHILLLGLLVDVYDVVDSYDDAHAMGFGHYARACTNRARVKDSSYNKEKLLLVKKDEVGLPLTPKENDFLVVVSDYEGEQGELNVNCILMAKHQTASSNTQTDYALDYDMDVISAIQSIDELSDIEPIY